VNIHKQVDESHVLNQIAEDHIRQAICHIKCYQSTWWSVEYYDQQESKLDAIINQLEALIS